MCPPLVASDKSITVVGIFIVSIGFSIAKMSQSYKRNLLLDLLLDPSFRSPHVKNSKTVLHSGFHAVHSGIKVLHSGFWNSDSLTVYMGRFRHNNARTQEAVYLKIVTMLTCMSTLPIVPHAITKGIFFLPQPFFLS